MVRHQFSAPSQVLFVQLRNHFLSWKRHPQTPARKIVAEGLAWAPWGSAYLQDNCNGRSEMGAFLHTTKKRTQPLKSSPTFQFRRARIKTATLSGGEQQMLAMGRALTVVQDFAFDEPSMDLLQSLPKKFLILSKISRHKGLQFFDWTNANKFCQLRSKL